MKYSFATIFSLLIAAVILTTPSNLFLVLNENVGYVNGMRIDYLMPKVYLSDIFIILSILLGLTKTQLSIKNIFTTHKSVFITVGLLFITSLLFSAHQFSAISSVLKITELSLFAFVIWKLQHILNKKILLFALGGALVIQTIFAVLQFWLQHTVTPYWLFGETQYTSSTIAISRATLLAQEKILSYGTTSHPNVLAGIVVLFSVIAHQINKKLKIILLLNVLVILFLTQSLSALLALIIAVTLLYFSPRTENKNIFLIGALLFIAVPLVNWLAAEGRPDNFSIFRRHELNFSAMKMFLAHPLTGVGLGNFTASLEPYLRQKELVRFIQPAHHIGMLWLAETGLLGVGLVIQFLALIKKYLARISLVSLAILPLISLDHYVMTIQSGSLATILFLVLIND